MLKGKWEVIFCSPLLRQPAPLCLGLADLLCYKYELEGAWFDREKNLRACTVQQR